MKATGRERHSPQCAWIIGGYKCDCSTADPESVSSSSISSTLAEIKERAATGYFPARGRGALADVEALLSIVDSQTAEIDTLRTVLRLETHVKDGLHEELVLARAAVAAFTEAASNMKDEIVKRVRAKSQDYEYGKFNKDVGFSNTVACILENLATELEAVEITNDQG